MGSNERGIRGSEWADYYEWLNGHESYLRATEDYYEHELRRRNGGRESGELLNIMRLLG
jgi:hypothetical protein